MSELNIERTARGFEIIKFADIYGEPSTLQESSLADRHAIWFGAGENRMHIDAELFEQLVPHIDRMLARTTQTAPLIAAMERAADALEIGLGALQPKTFNEDAARYKMMTAAITDLTNAIRAAKGDV